MFPLITDLDGDQVSYYDIYRNTHTLFTLLSFLLIISSYIRAIYSQDPTLVIPGPAGVLALHDDVIKWKHFPRYWPLVRGIHRSPVNSPHKGQWRGALMFSLTCALNKRLSKQSWGWWFETPTRSLWRHCNVAVPDHQQTQCWLKSYHAYGSELSWVVIVSGNGVIDYYLLHGRALPDPMLSNFQLGT